MEEYLKVVKEHYADFQGRARRREYWMFALFNFIISIVLGGVGTAIKMPFISTVYAFAVLIPGIAVGVRRLHDIGKSGWWLLIPIFNIVLLATDSTPQSNEYGASPKYGSDELNELGNN